MPCTRSLGSLDQHVKEYTYLGFKLTDDNKLKCLVQDRMSKCKRMIYMLSQALSVNGNVNVKLTMSVFDKQVVYLCYYMGLTSGPFQRTASCNIYINNVPEDIKDIRAYIIDSFESALGKTICIKHIKRVGKKCQGKPRTILCGLTNPEDKYDILFRQNIVDTGNTVTLPQNAIYENVHKSFCKNVLNVNKFSSNTACLGELGRFPLYIKAWTQVIKYWLRLMNGTKNHLLNEAFDQAKLDKHWWVQGVKDILLKFGCANLTTAAPQLSVHSKVALDFQQRLKHDYIQRWFTKINNSEHLKHLKICKADYGFSPYLANIQNIKIRNIVTKLRINNNNLGMSPKEKNKKCKWCNNDIYEDLIHVLIKCPKYTECRNFIKPLFNSNYDDSNILACILNVTDENVNSQ